MKRTVAVALACLLAVLSVITASPATFAQTRQSARSSSGAAPVFAFPVNGTAYPSNSPYVFQVQPVNGASGYLWSFVQGGVIVYQNLAWDGHLSPASYTVATGSKAHSLIHSGDLHVWVRALMKDDAWSATGAVMVRIQGKGQPPATPQPKPTKAPTHPVPGTVLYQADTAGGFDKWTGTPDWSHLNGALTNDGSNHTNSWIAAPYQVQSTNDYAVEAEIQVVKPLGSSDDGGFGIQARNSSKGAYNAVIWKSCCPTINAQLTAYTAQSNTTEPLVQQAFDPGTDWHTYRIEVQGNTIRFLVDGNALLSTQDNRFLHGNVVALWSSTQITVRSFKVVAL